MIVQLSDIKDRGLDLSFDKNRDEFQEMLNDPSGELRAAGDGLKVQVHLDRVDETIIVRGTLQAGLGFQCGLCTADREMSLSVPFEAVLMPRPSLFAGHRDEEEEIELTAEDLDVSFYEGLEFDLTEVIREAIFLEAPSYPSCGIEPREQCPDWQANISQKARDMEESNVDLRWEALKGLKKKMSSADD